MNNNKAFTLIELLAVIVILAVIALIVTPVITDIIKEVKQSANARSVEGHIKNVEYQIMQGVFGDSSNNIKMYDGLKKEEDLSFTYPNGDTIVCDIYQIENGIVAEAKGCVIGNKKYDYKHGENVGKGYDAVPKINALYVAGASTDSLKGKLYFDPTDLNKKCEINTSLSTTGTKKGCMKWLIYSQDDTKYLLILDHNTTNNVIWNSTGNSNDGINEIKTQLNIDTVDWDSSLKARLITSNEVAKIVGADTPTGLKWNSSLPIDDTPTIGNTISWYYLDGLVGTDTLWHTQVNSTQSSSRYAWLFDRTNNCTKYGCNINDVSNNGFWTSDKSTDTKAWAVTSEGRLYDGNVNSFEYGIRPVITVMKNALE